MTVIAADCADVRAYDEDSALGAILEILRERTGTDFSRYRSATIRRRVMNRMICVGAQSFEHYLGMLRVRESEALRLLERVTIKVSQFYRNRATFDLLRRHVIPTLATAARGRALRAWSAGCGYGEEAYTLAMLLEEAGATGTVEASDIDPAALSTAMIGHYPEAALRDLPEDLRLQYCERTDRGFLVTPQVRARVRFSRHDLTSDAPPPGGEFFDLVSCRNVLIYFDAQVQHRVLSRVRGAVRDEGCLCLGEAEWPTAALYRTLHTLDHKARLFRALPLCTA